MMNRTDGFPKSPIWLLADSNPISWQNHLEWPLDRRFPTRHTIWTPIENVIQGHLFREGKVRLKDKLFYIRNAVENPLDKVQKERRGDEITIFGDLLREHQPPLVLCFGQFAYEFALHARQEGERDRFRRWKIEGLAEEFEDGISNFRVDAINVLPLLHAIVALKFVDCHKKFSGGTGNYFEYVGGRIAGVLLEHRADQKFSSVWM